MTNYFDYDPEEELKTLKKIIEEYPDSKFIDFSYHAQINSLPHEIGSMKHLQEMRLNYCYRFSVFPVSMVKLQHLRSVQINCGRHKDFPDKIEQLTQIRRLSLSYQNYDAKSNWSAISKLTNLQALDLSASISKLKHLPPELFQLKNLEFLYLSSNKLKSLPQGFSELKQLRLLDLGYNNFKKLPTVLAQLPQLETLIINAQAINIISLDLFRLPKLHTLKVVSKNAKKYPHVSLIQKLFLQKQKRQLSLQYIAFLLEAIAYPESIQWFDKAELIDLLNSDLEYLVVIALPLLEKILKNETQQPLEAGSQIVLKGKLGGKKSILKQRLKSFEIKTAVKLNSKTTHLVVGRCPKVSWVEIQKAAPQATLLTEAMLLRQLNAQEQPYLLEPTTTTDKKETTLYHLRNLLNSRDEDNIFLAFEMLHGGGFPKALITDLFLLYKETNSPKIRKETLYFINQYGPSEFGLALKRRLRIFGVGVNENTIYKNLMYYCNVTLLDKKRIADYIYSKYKKGASFALLELSLSEKQAFFAQHLKQHKLNLSKLELSTLPKDLHLMGKIKELDLSHNHFYQLPALIFEELQDLETLTLKSMFYLHQFPTKLLNIRTLKRIVLNYSFKNMPSEDDFRKAGIELIYHGYNR